MLLVLDTPTTSNIQLLFNTSIENYNHKTYNAQKTKNTKNSAFDKTRLILGVIYLLSHF